MVRHFQLYYLFLSIALCIGFVILSVQQYNLRDFAQLEKSAIAARNTLDYFFKDRIQDLRELNNESRAASNCQHILPHLQAFTFVHPDISAIGLSLDGSYCVSIPGLAAGWSIPVNGLGGPLISPLIRKPYYIFRYKIDNRIYNLYLLASLLKDRMEKTSPFIDKASLILKPPYQTLQPVNNKPAYRSEFPWVNWQQHYRLPSQVVTNLRVAFVNDPEVAYHDFWLYELLQFGLFVLFLSIFYVPFHYYLRQRYSLKGSLKNALRQDQFFPVYQPIYDWRQQSCCAVEVLLRWQDNTKVIIPQEFIKVAEASGLIAPMTQQLVKKALAQLHPWLQADKSRHIAFNISRSHLLDTKLIDLLAFLCKKYAVEPDQIMLELTERDLIDETCSHTLDSLKKLREYGFLFAIDDFGTGHASIHYLNHVPANYLKIDMMYTHAIGTDSVTATLIDPIIHLAKELKLTLIAEGVETKAQAEYLQTRGVDLMQGWLYGKPMHGDEFLKAF